MREFETTRLVATVTVFADEGTAALIPGPHLTTYGNREVAEPPWPGGSRHGSSRFRRNAGLALVRLGQQGIERSLDDRGRIAIGDLVREQILQLLEFGEPLHPA